MNSEIVESSKFDHWWPFLSFTGDFFSARIVSWVVLNFWPQKQPVGSRNSTLIRTRRWYAYAGLLQTEGKLRGESQPTLLSPHLRKMPFFKFFSYFTPHFCNPFERWHPIPNSLSTGGSSTCPSTRYVVIYRSLSQLVCSKASVVRRSCYDFGLCHGQPKFKGEIETITFLLKYPRNSLLKVFLLFPFLLPPRDVPSNMTSTTYCRQGDQVTGVETCTLCQIFSFWISKSWSLLQPFCSLLQDSRRDEDVC
jgi:hypothetical protein